MNVFVCSFRLKVQWQSGQDFKQARKLTLQPSAQLDQAPVSRSVCVNVNRWAHVSEVIMHGQGKELSLLPPAKNQYG